MSDINNLLLSETEGATPAEHLEARNRGGWIAVKDRPPEYGKPVLIRFARSGHIEDATFHKDEYSDGWTYCLFDGAEINDEPSHWMTLPEPPKD